MYARSIAFIFIDRDGVYLYVELNGCSFDCSYIDIFSFLNYWNISSGIYPLKVPSNLHSSHPYLPDSKFKQVLL